MRKSLKALLVLIAGASLATQTLAGNASSSTFIPAAEAKWAAVPGMDGIQIAVLEGDPSKGPSHFMLKFTGGFSAPLHHHSADHFGTVVAGTLVLTSNGKEQKLPAGSFFAFSGQMPHATKCEAGAACVLSMDVRGKWDVVAEKVDAKK
ncbi:MAG TPA: cupin domain-containing protein [Polyangiaceae bacterium]|nr:cupin domain-containing protein [Polyangiaceae bacterium]